MDEKHNGNRVSVTCKLKCTGFMQILDIFSPIQYPDIAFFLWCFRKCKATCIKMFFWMQCVLRSTLWWASEPGRGMVKERGGAGRGGAASRWLSSILVPNSWLLCVLYSSTVHQWIPPQHSAIKNQHTTKWKLRYCSCTRLQYGSVYDILLIYLLTYLLYSEDYRHCRGNATRREGRKWEWFGDGDKL